MKRLFTLGFILLVFGTSVFAQVFLPRESQRQDITQTVGDTKIAIVYHRPSVKGRKVWGGLVPYGQVWRTGANENTTIEFTRDVTINGQPLVAGKYGFHAIPETAEWTLIFNKVNDSWGSFTYDQKNDALRVKVKPIAVSDSRENLTYEIEDVTADSAKIVLGWEKLEIPFTVNIGDIQGRMMTAVDEAIKTRKADDARPLNQGAGYVFSAKVKNRYNDALGWLDSSLAIKETFGTLVTKARLLEQAGRTAEAIAAGEKAIAFGKALTPPAPTADIERFVAEWKTKK